MTSKTDPQPRRSTAETVGLLAVLTCLVAFSIDAMLPAFPAIGRDLRVENQNDVQFIIGAIFAGLSLGQLIYGPLSDSIGRKPAIYIGLVLFIGGTVICIVAPSLEVMLVGRFLQGLGAAGPKLVSVPLVRDQFKGAEMARIMSFTMTVFLIVPACAPMIGQAILWVADWRSIFLVILATAFVGLIWLWARQPETHPVEKRIPSTPRVIWAGAVETLKNRQAFGYMMSGSLIFGAFIGFLTSAQQIFQVTFDVGERFPLYFGALALAMGAASATNGRIVARFGMEQLSKSALAVQAITSSLFLIWLLTTGGEVSIALFLGWGALTFACFGMVFGNINALAMEPMGHIAGVAAAVIASFMTLISVVIGSAIGQAYDGNVLPLVGGFAILGSLAFLPMWWAGRGHTKTGN